MCGICGIYGQTNKPVGKMLGVLRHRGHDGIGIISDANIQLGHTRLAIIDLSENGNQPMHNENETVWLSVNGEIYNYKDLRSILRDKGHNFYSNSDSEVIIHAYEQWGEAFVQQLRGMFALALYDKTENKLILARDPIGKKPLYYYSDGRCLYFASEIKALLAVGVPFKVNYEMIPTFMMYQYSMGNRTLFSGIRKLMAGTMLVAVNNGYFIKKYFDIGECISNASEKESIETLRDYLRESVRLRLQSDVPVGAFLSGGIDSSAVVALWREQSNSDIHTFTASFGRKHSEAKYAQQVSRYLDTEYHEVSITVDMVLNDIRKITWHHDEPLGDAATINNYYLSKEANKYVKVVLAGEGGDELFGGYTWYKYANKISLFNAISPDIRKLLQLLFNGDITSRFYKYSRMALFPLQDSLEAMQLFPTSVTNQQSIRWLTRFNHHCGDAVIPQFVHNPYNQMLAMDCLNKLPEQFLMKADKGTMANTIEERLPLLDKEIIRYAFTLPIKFKKNKYILRKSVEGMLPHNIVERDKQGFGTPINSWLSDNMFKAYVVDRIAYGSLIKDICNKERLSKIINMYDCGQYQEHKYAALSFSAIIWNLFVLQVWYDVFNGGS